MNMLAIFFWIVLGLAASPNVKFVTSGGPFVGINTTVNIISGNITGFYYATEAFFENQHVGYMGWQPRQDRYLQHLVFSAFGDGPHSDSEHCNDGADAGAGVSCASEYPWRFGQNYTIEMIRTHHDDSDGSNTWTGSIIDDCTGIKTKIAHYTTPESYGLLMGRALCFDEYFPWNGDGKTADQRDCVPKSDYIQYMPVMIDESGEVHQMSFYSFTNLDNRDDKCSVEQDKSNINVTRLSETAFEFNFGYLS